jgi:hypothetical protein
LDYNSTDKDYLNHQIKRFEKFIEYNKGQREVQLANQRAAGPDRFKYQVSWYDDGVHNHTIIVNAFKEQLKYLDETSSRTPKR